MVKSVFSIKDLENLSGIKAHTIRIWEKRYNLLKPERTDTNIRSYNLQNLQKLLNITQLYINGYKISKIARMDDEKIRYHVNKIAEELTPQELALADFKMAMVNFDAHLFHTTCNKLMKRMNFSDVFFQVLVPLLNELGLLWQTDAVKPSHEHFITSLIKQTILLNIRNTQVRQNINTNQGVFVLYLPDNEIHDIGLTYVYYELLNKGYKTIYLGQSLPMNCLPDFNQFYDKITFITYFTVQPEPNEVNDYVQRFQEQVNPETKHELWILGRQIQYFTKNKDFPFVSTFDSIYKLIQKI